MFDGVKPVHNLIHKNFNARNNIVRIYASPTDADYNDIGFTNLAGTKASDFELKNMKSPAVDAGATIPDTVLDYSNRKRPNGDGLDIGAFEYYQVGNK